MKSRFTCLLALSMVTTACKDTSPTKEQLLAAYESSIEHELLAEKKGHVADLQNVHCRKLSPTRFHCQGQLLFIDQTRMVRSGVAFKKNETHWIWLN